MSSLQKRSWVEQVMGLPISVLARGPVASTTAADIAVQAVYRELREVDGTFSTYRPDSEVSRLARGELGWEEASSVVREVADRCRRARELTGGLFDAETPAGGWDPSGLVKGWAAERASRLLAEVDGADWCLNAGGDVVVICPSGEPFTVGIQDPADSGAVVATVRSSGNAVATSGTAARGAHLYDPRSGGAVVGSWASVSVTGPSLEWADVLATAAFVADDEWPRVVSLLPGYAGLGVHVDGTVRAMPTWPSVTPRDAG
ncbi:FAD:protein FMN transferase [Kribbella sp. NBC_00382]|uniref:FAD:protein FMN transferase n=1 Tax=Kribbella sp. NBC_00382 TaxID=2975967 RepID=UPI002E22B29D